MSGAATPTSAEAPPLDDRDVEPRTPMKRLGSTRKLAAFNNIRLQLSEQARVLEARAEATAGVAGELHEYCRRRADLEHEYARALDKLARAAAQRHKDQRHKRELWPLSGAHACWTAALDATRALARDHAALAELYGGPLAARLQRAADDALRLHRKCRDVLAERHEEVGAALAEAAAAGKAHAAAAAAWRAAALKLRHAYDTRQRLAAADPPRHKKLKALDKELAKRRARHADARLAALRARADYVLALEAANATLQRYYLDDIADIILCMEVGFEAAVGRVARTAAAGEAQRAGAAGEAAGTLRAAAEALDALADRQRLLDAHAATFALPRPLAYQGAAPAAQDADARDLLGDADQDDEPARRVRDELLARLAQLDASARATRLECQENAKTLDAAEAELVKQMEGAEAAWDVSRMFGAGGGGAAAAPAGAGGAGAEQEDYYLAKFRAYVASAGRLARLEGKAAGVRARLLGGARAPPASPPRRAARPRRGLFGAAPGRRLPAVLTSCVRVIAAHGLRQQGVFRVSGSQLEVQALRAAFERGEDPLARGRGAADVNSVCGLLKLFLRELRPPLLPPQLQGRLLRVAALPEAQFVPAARATLAALAPPAVLVLRYLFAFLAHLAEHSAHNMMDAWNLAICLGPTLLAAWGEGGAQVTAQNLVNELVKRIILHHLEVFPQDVAPYALYTRCSEADAEADGDTDAEADDTAPAPADRTDASGGEPDSCDLHDPHDPHDAPDLNDSQERSALSLDEHDASDAPDEQDVQDDLSLYDDDDEEDITDEEGDWVEADSAECRRRGAGGGQDEVSAEPEQAAGATLEAEAPAEAGAEAEAQAEGRRLLAESTPDLVLDLPARGDAADTFVHNRDTLKKRAAGAAGGSPVPPRNTARVAAKFAELTLTGGSLKPALAAKPALLRRPTPHPHAPRAAPPAEPL